MTEQPKEPAANATPEAPINFRNSRLDKSLSIKITSLANVFYFDFGRLERKLCRVGSAHQNRYKNSMKIGILNRVGVCISAVSIAVEETAQEKWAYLSVGIIIAHQHQ